MQVLCKSSSDSVDTRCRVCGQGFVLFWERETPMERAKALQEIERTLRNHHRKESGPQAHPQHGFLVLEWRDQVAFSGTSVLGSAPTWDL
jgi:hypothetical protein